MTWILVWQEVLILLTDTYSHSNSVLGLGLALTHHPTSCRTNNHFEHRMKSYKYSRVCFIFVAENALGFFGKISKHLQITWILEYFIARYGVPFVSKLCDIYK